MPAIKLDAEKLMKKMEMTATITEGTRFRLRKWVAIRLMWLAAWVLGCGIEVVSSYDPERAVRDD